jgi:L-lactate dehydrogenase
MIIEAIMLDANRTLPVSTLVSGNYGLRDVCLSLPAVVGRDGITKCLEISLDDKERSLLKQSADRLSEAIRPLRPLWSGCEL